jgi:hypothetical protein
MRGAEETTSSVEETSMAIGGNSNCSSQDSGSRTTTFSMSLASISAAAASEPETSDEGMADLRVDEAAPSESRQDATQNGKSAASAGRAGEMTSELLEETHIGNDGGGNNLHGHMRSADSRRRKQDKKRERRLQAAAEFGPKKED